MLPENTTHIEKPITGMSKISDYAQFIKLRLASLVVLSAAIGFVVGSHNVGSHEVNWTKMLLLIIGGFLVTCSSNGFNQLIEKDLDKLMDRTQNRPLPQGRMSSNEAFILAALMGISGIIILWAQHTQNNWQPGKQQMAQEPIEANTTPAI